MRGVDFSPVRKNFIFASYKRLLNEGLIKPAILHLKTQPGAKAEMEISRENISC